MEFKQDQDPQLTLSKLRSVRDSVVALKKKYPGKQESTLYSIKEWDAAYKNRDAGRFVQSSIRNDIVGYLSFAYTALAFMENFILDAQISGRKTLDYSDNLEKISNKLAEIEQTGMISFP